MAGVHGEVGREAGAGGVIDVLSLLILMSQDQHRADTRWCRHKQKREVWDALHILEHNADANVSLIAVLSTAVTRYLSPRLMIASIYSCTQHTYLSTSLRLPGGPQILQHIRDARVESYEGDILSQRHRAADPAETHLRESRFQQPVKSCGSLFARTQRHCTISLRRTRCLEATKALRQMIPEPTSERPG